MYEPLKASKQLEVLAFSCDQFMHQAGGDTNAVCSFAAKKGAKWPLFDQVDVNGPNASPVFNFLKASAGDASDIEWNFAKFLVGVRRPARPLRARRRCCWRLAALLHGAAPRRVAAARAP